jgi:ribosomal protein L40E
MGEMLLLMAKLAMPAAIIIGSAARFKQYSKYKKKQKQMTATSITPNTLHKKVICVKCGNTLQENDRFCDKCGTKCDAFKKDICIKCGNALQGNDKFCDKCGTANLLEKETIPIISNTENAILMRSEARIVWMRVKLTCYPDRFEIYNINTKKTKVREFSYIQSVDKYMGGSSSMGIVYKDTTSEIITFKDGTRDKWINFLKRNITPF